jgi:uncharacterized circularly permuted ATP-grasp superfamily protein/uncharacterized alpha-E superfamily protein
MKLPDDTINNELCHWYRTEPGCFDEMWVSDNQLRPHWEYFTASLRALGCSELEHRRQEAGRLLRENGVTYNVYGDPEGVNRPWELDPVPLLISSEEWSHIERGLIQRAELLNLILHDIYGARELIKKRLIPLELIYGHRGFLRACDQVKLPGEHQLITYAADLARGPTGSMWVLSDRTQAPSGAGYALENRMAMGRIFPSLFRDCHVHRLALFFRALRTSLSDIAPHNKEDPNIVVLTPGPRNETYFEHAYLASYLGYNLVQGADLTVRDERVWLKSLDGLMPVDIILRRVDDHFCDPLELREDSQLGVPGLLHAARCGNVSIVNPLGSSVLENPGLMAFLPVICKHLLGQELRIPSIATWWCGHPKERDYVLNNIDKLVIKPIYRHPASKPVFGNKLSKKEKETLKARIKTNPHVFMGQEQASISTTPSLGQGRLEPRHAVLRSFLVAREGDYSVMPGGLTRVASSQGTMVISNQAGGVSKDTWVLASEPEKQVSLWLQATGEQMIAARTSFPSRVVENLFWVGRYVERAEAASRLLRTLLQKYNETREFDDGTSVACLHTLLYALTNLTGTYPGFANPDNNQLLAQPNDELLDVALNVQRTGSLYSSLRAMIHAVYAVRDLWSNDTWRIIDDVDETWGRLSKLPDIGLHLLPDELDRLMVLLSAFSGLTMESMTREQGWLFLDIGRRLERGIMLNSLLRSTLVSKHSEGVEYQLLESLLLTHESLMTYRRRYRAYMEQRTVLDLMLMDETNPRSLIYQMDRLQQHISVLPREKVFSRVSQEERLILEAMSQLRLSDTTQLAQIAQDAPMNTQLDQRLARISNLLARLSDTLTKYYFSHVEGPQQLTPTQLDPDL